MNNIMEKTPFRLALAFIFLAGSTTAHAGLQEGITAYQKGNYPAALQKLRPLADSGDSKAQALLGEMYDSGKGVPQNHAEAASWYRKAAEQGNAAAQTTLGVMYENGVGVTQDNNEAVSWYKKATEQKYAEAQYILGVMYRSGQGALPIDLVQAHKWFSLSVTAGFEIAQQDMEEIQEKMSSEQIEEARLMAKEWLAKHK